MIERRRAVAWAAVLVPAMLAAAPAVAAPTVTAEEAMANYRKSFETGALIDCRRDPDSDEIVVCARSGRPDPNRVPLPDEREPGERVRLLPGEPPSAVAALSAGSGMGCSTSNIPRCNGGLDVFRVVGVLGKAFKALRGRE